jgi:chromosome segregation ATPase
MSYGYCQWKESCSHSCLKDRLIEQLKDQVASLSAWDSSQTNTIIALNKKLEQLTEEKNFLSASNDLHYQEMLNLQIENKQQDAIIDNLQVTNEALLERIVEVIDELDTKKKEWNDKLKESRGNLDHVVGLNRELKVKLQELEAQGNHLTVTFN